MSQKNRNQDFCSKPSAAAYAMELLTRCAYVVGSNFPVLWRTEGNCDSTAGCWAHGARTLGSPWLVNLAILISCRFAGSGPWGGQRAVAVSFPPQAEFCVSTPSGGSPAQRRKRTSVHSHAAQQQALPALPCTGSRPLTCVSQSINIYDM